MAGGAEHPSLKWARVEGLWDSDLLNGFSHLHVYWVVTYRLNECKCSSEIPVSSMLHRDVKVSSFAILGNCGGGSVDNSTWHVSMRTRVWNPGACTQEKIGIALVLAGQGNKVDRAWYNSTNSPDLCTAHSILRAHNPVTYSYTRIHRPLYLFIILIVCLPWLQHRFGGQMWNFLFVVSWWPSQSLYDWNFCLNFWFLRTLAL